jgi:hypothetical protein
MKVVPKEFRVYSEFCFTHFAKKGGANTGYCGLHVDKNSIVNGLFQFGVLDKPGGSTIFYSTGNCECGRQNKHFVKNHRQLARVLHRHGNKLLVPFHTAVHGVSTWYDFRFTLGLYVDIRVLKFCLKLKNRNEARSKEEFIRNYNIFNIVKEESVVGSQEVEKRLKEGGFEKY